MMNRILLLFLSFLYFIVIAYINEWIVVNEPLYYSKDTKPLYDIGHYYLFQSTMSKTIPQVLFFVLLGYAFFRSFMFGLDVAISFMISYFVIAGSIMILRLFSFTLTKLPPPEPICINKPSWQHKLWIHYEEKACGDYMFSGHSIHFVLVALFFSYLSPYTIEKICIWIYSVISMMTLVASRIHYSIDVLISFYITFLSFYAFRYLTQQSPLFSCFI
jgi:hypothetical protein